MQHTADVVVVGAGVNGLSTAFHLARAGVKRVVVVEQHHLAAGATGKSGALVRMHYTNEPETRLAFESLKYFGHWGDMVGGECGFQAVGLLVFVPPALRDHLEANVAMHRRIGVNASVIISPGKIATHTAVSKYLCALLSMLPQLATGGWMP